MNPRIPLSALATCMLSACAVGPNYTAPTATKAEVGPFVSAASGIDATREPPSKWWQLYEDPALDGYVSEALAANTDLRVALANLTLADAVVSEARAGRYPTTTLAAGETYGRNGTVDTVSSALKGRAHNLYTTLGDINVSYEVDLFGRVTRIIEASKADAEATAAALDAVRTVVAANTTRAYVDACAAGAELDVAAQAAKSAADYAKIVARQHDHGGASTFDATRAQVLADQAAAKLPAFEGRRRAAVLELTNLLGRPPANAPQDPGKCSTLPKISSPLPVGDGANLISRRPDIREAERRIAAATARQGIAMAGIYPRITFGANYGYASNQALQGANALSLAVGPMVSRTFPNQAAARARIRESDASTQAALANFDGTVLRALKETEQALSAYQFDAKRHQVLAIVEADAQRAYDLSRKRLGEGALSQLDLLLAEQTLIAAQAESAAAKSRLADDQVNLFEALGGGW